MLAGALWAAAASGTLVWNGAGHQPVPVDPAASSGLDAVWVVPVIDGLSLKFTPAADVDELTWSRFSKLGGAYAEPVAVRRDGKSWVLDNPEADMGYMIEMPGGQHYYFWVVDWSAHPYSVSSLGIASTDCSATTLHMTGHAGRLVYTSINGRELEIDRGITVTYTSLTYDADTEAYSPVQLTESRAWLPEEFNVPAPLCQTSFTLTGDRFLRAWGLGEQVESERVDPIAVDCHTEVTATERDNDNEQPVEGAEIGGSGPVEVNLTAAVTDAAIFTEWQISADPEFEIIDYRESDPVTQYTFRETGTRYVRFMAANADASCEYASDVYTVFVGESDLKIPNAFSPGASEGTNDIWKVSYRSIVSFECHIFNKWGEKMCQFSDPSGGWDGRYRGKLVPSGVYYYVIKARGADGRNWDCAGDINIVNYR